MSDDPLIAGQSIQPAKSLNRLAEALGVPVSNFYEQEGDTSSAGDCAEPRDAAILAFIDVYLATINVERRRTFLAAVQAMVDAPQTNET